MEGLAGPAPEGPAVRVPVLALEIYERYGGHTLRRHVGTSPSDDLRRVKGGLATGAGSFLDRDTAQRCVEVAIGRHAAGVRAWQRETTRFAPYTIWEDMHEVIGHSITWADVKRRVSTPRPVTGVFMVLRRRPELPGGYLVLTAYPTRARRRVR